MRRAAWALGGCLLAISLLSPVSRAQDSANVEDPAEQLRREQQLQQDQERLRSVRPGQSIQTTPPSGPVPEEACFPVRAIEVRGVTVLDRDTVDALVAPFADHCMGQLSIESLLQTLTGAFVERGYITTRAYVPQQDISNGVLAIEVTEGRIAAFVYQTIDGEGRAEAGAERKIHGAFPIKAGDILQLRDIEQGLDQINRLPSSRAAVNIRPGDEPGSSVVEIQENYDDNYRGSFSIDNAGGEDTGRARSRLSIEFIDVLSVSERLSLTVLGTQNSNVLAADASVPLANWLISVNGSYSESLTPVDDAVDLFSQTANAGIEVERLLFRDAEKKVHLYGSFGAFSNSRFLNNQELETQNRTVLRGGFRQERVLPGAGLTVDLGFALGVPLFGADGNVAAPGRTTPRARFAKLDLRVGYSQQFEDGPVIVSSLIGQFARQPLFSNELLSVGGWETVRGYNGESVAGETGVFVRNDLLLGVWSDRLRPVDNDPDLARSRFRNIDFVAQPFVFVDCGVASNIALGETRTQAGLGFGMRGSLGRLSFALTLALPLTDGGVTGNRSMQGLVNVTTKLY